MATFDNDAHPVTDPSTDIQPCYRIRWTKALPALLGSVAVVIAAAVTAGTPLASSPTSTAAPTVTATPWSPGTPAWLPPGLQAMTPPPARKPTAQVSLPSPPPQANASGSWASATQAPLHDLQNAVQALSDAMKAQDMDGVKAACGQLNNAGQRLGATLPSPERALTSEVQAAVDDIGTASNSCSAFGPSGGIGDLDAFTSTLNDAWGHLGKAQQIEAGLSRR